MHQTAQQTRNWPLFNNIDYDFKSKGPRLLPFDIATQKEWSERWLAIENSAKPRPDDTSAQRRTLSGALAGHYSHSKTETVAMPFLEGEDLPENPRSLLASDYLDSEGNLKRPITRWLEISLVYILNILFYTNMFFINRLSLLFQEKPVH